MHMDATGMNAGAKAAIGTLKESIAIGKEGGKLVADVQADMHAAINKQQQQRQKERRQQQHAGTHQEQKAYQRFLEVSQETKDSAELKSTILKNHGTKGWEEFLKIKAEVDKQEKEDAKAMGSDEQRLHDAMWWCFGAAATIAYFVVVM